MLLSFSMQEFLAAYPWLPIAVVGGVLVIAALAILLRLMTKKKAEGASAETEEAASPEKLPCGGADHPAATPCNASAPPAEDSCDVPASPEEVFCESASSPEKASPEASEITPEATLNDVSATASETAPEADVAPHEKHTSVSGKYVFVLADDGYHFCLLANNGQLLYESVGYTTLTGAKSGVETFRRAATAENARFMIRSDRGGKYSYVLNGKYYGEGYTAKTRCERAIQSVKHFAGTENFTEPAFEKEEMTRYAAAKASLKAGTEADFAAMEAKSAAVKKSGKFVIDTEEGGASFSLLANNGKCLYTSRLFSDERNAEKAILAFKKAVYLDNFFVTDDKFGNFRFALKGTGSNWYVGDSYATKDRCANSIESVKQFALSAEIVYGTQEEELPEV